LADGLKEGNYFFGSVVVASGAPFLAPFSSPASPLLTALYPRLWRVCGCGGRGGGLGFGWRYRQHRWQGR
jgi:hypothetical protein